MSASNSFKYLFSTSKHKNPTLFESLNTYNPIKCAKPNTSGFMEIFGELYFKETSVSDLNLGPNSEKLNSNSYGYGAGSSFDFSEGVTNKKCGTGYSHDYGFSKNSSETLPDCNEGLGFESYNMFEKMKVKRGDDYKNDGKVRVDSITQSIENMEITSRFKRSWGGKGFPPPISCLGSEGNPGFCLKSYRCDGRLILKVIRIPPQEFMHATQEDGSLIPSFVQPGEDIDEEEVEECWKDNENGKEKGVQEEDNCEILDHDAN